MRAVKLDEVAGWVEGLCSDHIVEGRGIVRIMGKPGSEFATAEVMGHKWEIGW